MNAIVWLIVTVIDLYFWVIIAAAILSWLVAFNVVNPRNQVVATLGEALFRMTEPALAPIRRFMPNLGGIDISPVILLLLLGFLKILILDVTASVR